jgi:hypothetical protein
MLEEKVILHLFHQIVSKYLLFRNCINYEMWNVSAFFLVWGVKLVSFKEVEDSNFSLNLVFEHSSCVFHIMLC